MSPTPRRGLPGTSPAVTDPGAPGRRTRMSDPTTAAPAPDDSSRRSGSLRRAPAVSVVGCVLFSFISYWRTAAGVLCDLAGAAYDSGGSVEQSIGPAAPWLILAVMLFSFCVPSVYIESCAMFV